MGARFLSRSVRWTALGGAAVAVLAACGSTSYGGSAGGGTPASGAGGSPSVAPGAVVGTASSSVGTYLVDAQGKTLYAFAADTMGHSNCTGSCVHYWPVVAAPATIPSQEPGLTATLGSITRADGTKQLTVDGWPAYTYVGDSTPGATSGQGLNASGGLWWLFDTTGKWITSSAASSAPSASTSSGYGHGY